MAQLSETPQIYESYPSNSLYKHFPETMVDDLGIYKKMTYTYGNGTIGVFKYVYIIWMGAKTDSMGPGRWLSTGQRLRT